MTGSHVYEFVAGAAGVKAPTLLLLHGTGGDERSLLGLGNALWPGAALLSPRGQALEHGMPRFFRRLAEGVFDEEDLVLRTHALADFVREAAERHRFDAGRVVAAGYSNGANIAASLLLLRPEVLRGAVLLRPMVPLRREELPKLGGVGVWMASGRRDAMVPAANVEELAGTLRRAGADVTHLWSDAGHELTSPEVAAAGEWLRASFGSGSQDG